MRHQDDVLIFLAGGEPIQIDQVQAFQPKDLDLLVQAFRDFADGPISRKLPIDALLYNKVELELWRHDEEGRAIGKTEKIEEKKIVVRFDEALYNVDAGLLDLAPFAGRTVKEAIALFHEAARNAELTVVEVSGGQMYGRENETGTIWVGPEKKGLGVLSVKAKAAKSRGQECARVEIVLDRLLEKDHETVPYSSDEAANNRLIADFLAKWVHEPWCLHGWKTGCEINFNRVFPKTSDIRSSKEILKDIAAVEDEMARLEAEIAADFGPEA